MRPYIVRRDDLAPGDRVTVTALLMRGQAGTLVRETRLLNRKPGWIVRMDNPKGFWRGRTRVGDRAIRRISE